MNKRKISPLILRIFLVNTTALLVLVIGLLYTSQYEQGLIDTKTTSLAAEGRLLAAALSQKGTRESESAQLLLADDLVRRSIRNLVDTTRLRIIVFNKTGQLLLDSHLLSGPGGVVQMIELDPPVGTWDMKKRFHLFISHCLSLLPSRLQLPLFPDTATQKPGSYPGIIDALEGQTANAVFRDQDKRLLLTTAVPVQQLKNVLGAVLIVKDGHDITLAVRNSQFTVLKLFGLALIITFLFTLYLSETIVRPLARLAGAAKRIQHSPIMKDELPDLSYRQDEIGDLSKAFKDMTLALTERIDSIGRFAADVAHEIKNPLASVQSAIETLPKVQDKEQKEKLLAVIHDDITRITRLVTDISNASRTDSDIARSEKKPFDYADMLRRIVDAERSAIKDDKKIELFLDLDRRIPVTGNDTQLAQVIHNLINNAQSFATPCSKISIHVQTETGKIFTHIDNDGPHIPANKLEAVFERFYSERPEGEKFGLHSGLGLSISRQIIRSHKGEIFAVNCTDKKGTPTGVRFTIILPAGGGTI